MRPLADIRIVALEQYGAGPFGSMHLVELGADVIKIEDPTSGGDVGRYVPPFNSGEDSLFFETFNAGKRSISLDITTRAGRLVFEELIATADALYSNLRGDVPEKLRIRFDDLQAINPKIVCCALSGYGSNGPRAKDPGYDYMLQGLTGWMSLTGDPDGPPTRSGLSLVDYSGGFVAALSLLAGVHAARRDGVGMDCDVSLFDTAISMLSYPATWWLTEGYATERLPASAHPSLVPFQSFETTDGWIVVGCAKEKFWLRLATAIGRPELTEDPRYADFAARHEYSSELLSVLGTSFLEKSTREWLKILTEGGVPCAPINTIAEALADPQVQHRDLIVSSSHPTLGEVRQIRSPVRVGHVEAFTGRAPRRGEHADEILRDLLRYDSAKISELQDGGAFG
jgi:crotonobetainyl-CoA:carnitine CoA-transferase CaiB-like acyl-CoA transferase